MAELKSVRKEVYLYLQLNNRMSHTLPTSLSCFL